MSFLRAADRSLADSPLTYALHPLRFSRADGINLPCLSLPHVLPTILPSIAAPQNTSRCPIRNASSNTPARRPLSRTSQQPNNCMFPGHIHKCPRHSQSSRLLIPFSKTKSRGKKAYHVKEHISNNVASLILISSSNSPENPPPKCEKRQKLSSLVPKAVNAAKSQNRRSDPRSNASARISTSKPPPKPPKSPTQQ